MIKIIYRKGLIPKRRYILINLLFRRQGNYILFLAISFLMAGIFYPYPSIAMWIGFALAAYSAVANDSIQTIGTFISSNTNKQWWLLWLYIAAIFLMTVLYSWYRFDGDVTYQRLATKGFFEAPNSFHFLQISAPIFLLIITRLKMPVSTTFLLLSSFGLNENAISSMMRKSITGYLIAFFAALAFWLLLDKFMKKWFRGKPGQHWVVFQWITSGFLWSLWIMQDAANIAVFLPRKLGVIEFIIFSLTIIVGLGIILYLKGDKIQEIVEEKSEVKDVRPATMIDMVYTFILIYFTWINTVPMSTTWVFIGLLGGRELGMKIRRHKPLRDTWRLIGKDILYALAGLIISIIIAIAANETLRAQLLGFLSR